MQAAGGGAWLADACMAHALGEEPPSALLLPGGMPAPAPTPDQAQLVVRLCLSTARLYGARLDDRDCALPLSGSSGSPCTWAQLAGLWRRVTSQMPVPVPWLAGGCGWFTRAAVAAALQREHFAVPAVAAVPTAPAPPGVIPAIPRLRPAPCRAQPLAGCPGPLAAAAAAAAAAPRWQNYLD